MAATVGTVEVGVELTGAAARAIALDHAVTIEAAAASADGTYNADRVVNVAKGFQQYLATPEGAESLESQVDRLAAWLLKHTDEPQGSYGAVDAAIAWMERHLPEQASA